MQPLQIALLVSAALAPACAATLVSVSTNAGIITGSRHEDTGFSFVGIPYASAQRWQPPSSVPYFNTTLVATSAKPSCAQICREVSMLCPTAISEDCLSLNVWTPFVNASAMHTTDSAAPAQAKLPVLLLIHGGSFKMGGADVPALRGSEVAAALNAIVVTFNYRLSVFGFVGASVTSSTVPNLGILDQRMAIDWVAANIAAFGGDPARITLAGQSAGAMSAIVHASTPATRAKIRSLLLMSPPAVPLRSPTRAELDFVDLAARAGCHFDVSDPMLAQCMLAKTDRELLDALDAQNSDAQKIPSIDTTLPPILDGNILSRHPNDILADAASMAGLPIMIGATSNETSKFLESLTHVMPQAVYNVALDALFLDSSTKVRSLYADQVTPLVDGNLGKTLVAIESDHLFVCAPLRSARRLASTTPQTKTGKPSQPAAAVYSYFWETPWTGTLDDPVGRLCGEDACHTTDLIMLFRAPADDHGAKITAAFRRYVANFLATADPNTAADAATLASVPAAQTLPTWPQFGASSPQAVPAMRFARSSSRAVASEPVVTLERVHPNAARCELMDTIPYEYEPAIAADGQDTVSISRRWIVLLWTVLGCFIAMQVVLLLFAKLFFKRIQMLMDIVALVRGRPTSVGNEQAQWPMLSSPSKVDLGNMQAEAADFTHSASRYDDPANKEALLSEVLDFQPSPVAVDCNRLKYVVGSGASSKTILEDVTFSCKPGSLTALIGPSGAGKTSLMSLLARRTQSTDAQQCISYQGRQLSHMRTSEFQRLVGFVPQHNPPYTGLTPLEVLTAYAKLELAPRTTVGQIAHRVSYILDALGLLPCANVVIQDAAEHKGGISGGQLRRIPIGVALLKQPSVLILDEPTSGLDSRASLEVMQILAELAKKGYTIIVSIHQPRREIFELFTDVILLAQGRLLFNGSPKECVGFTREVKRVVTLSTATLGGRTSLASIPSWPSPPASPFSEAATTAGKASEQEQAQQDAGIELLNPADAILDVVGGIPKSDVPEIARFGRRWRTLSATYSVKTESSHESIPQAADQQPETRTRPSQITLRAPETTASGLGETPASMSMASPEGKSLGPISLLSRSIDTVRIPVEGSPPTMLRIPPRLAAPPLPTRASMVQAPASVSGNSSIVVVVQPSAPHSDSSESANAAHAGDEHATREISDEDAPDEPQVSDALLDGPSAYTFPTDGHQPMTLSDHPSAVIGKSGSEAVFTHPNSHLSMDLSDGNQQADSNTPQGRSGTLGQMIVANARWWRRRPLIRKLFMPIVSIAATLLLGFMQRRTESDMTGIVLQIKGLAIASVGLGALKNINISFDYYEDRDLYDFDSSNGAVGPFAFFIHRLIYETATSTVESTAAGALAIAILGSQASPSRIATILALIVTYYNCLVSFITLIYSTRLSRPEARSVSFFSLVMIALTSGLWIKRGDTALYSVMAWIETINPTYWLLTPMLRANVAGVGACLIQAGPFAECRAWEGDLILEEARVDRVPADVCLGALIIIWAVLRGMQLVLLVRDANAPKLAAWFCRSIKRSA